VTAVVLKTAAFGAFYEVKVRATGREHKIPCFSRKTSVCAAVLSRGVFLNEKQQEREQQGRDLKRASHPRSARMPCDKSFAGERKTRREREHVAALLRKKG